MDPVTQDTEAVVESTEQEEKSGAEKRIAELVRARHEAERERDAARAAADEARAQAAQAFAAFAQRQAQPEIPEEVPEFEPEEAKKLQYLLRKAQEPLMKELEGLKQARAQEQRQAVQAQHADEYRRVQEVLSKLNREDVTSEVNQLMAHYKQRGYLDNGTAGPEVALDIALGRAAKRDLVAKQSADVERAAFNAGGVPAPFTTGSRRSPQAPAAGKAPGLPADVRLENMSLEELQQAIKATEDENPDGLSF